MAMGISVTTAAASRKPGVTWMEPAYPVSISFSTPGYMNEMMSANTMLNMMNTHINDSRAGTVMVRMGSPPERLTEETLRRRCGGRIARGLVDERARRRDIAPRRVRYGGATSTLVIWGATPGGERQAR